MAAGHDVAFLRDTAGDETLVATATYTELSGDGFLRRAPLDSMGIVVVGCSQVGR